MNILCTNRTTALTTTAINVPNNCDQIAFFATGLSTGETVTIEFSIDGTTWETLKQYGVTVALTSTNNAVGAFCPARLRLVKPVTANPVTLAFSTKDSTQVIVSGN